MKTAAIKTNPTLTHFFFLSLSKEIQTFHNLLEVWAVGRLGKVADLLDAGLLV